MIKERGFARKEETQIGRTNKLHQPQTYQYNQLNVQWHFEEISGKTNSREGMV